MTNRKRVRTMCVALASALAVLAVPLSIGRAGHRALAASVFMIAGWILEPIHPAFIGLLGCSAFWGFAGIRPGSAFHGFLTPTPWYVYGAIILGVMADDSGVARRVGELLPWWIARSHAGATLTLIAFGYLVGLVVPSAPAAALIVALVAIGLVRRLAAEPGAHDDRMLVVTAGYAAALFGHAAGTGATAAARLPWDIAAAAACWFVVSGRRFRPAAPATDTCLLPPVPPAAKGLDGSRVAVLMAIGIVAWVTTPVHGVPPAAVGLAMGLVASVPGVGAAPSERAAKPDPLAVIVVGSALSMSWALATTGAVEVVRAACIAFARATTGWVPAKIAFYVAAVGYHLFVPEAANEATPWIARLAEASGAGINGAVIWSVAGSVMVALYQSPALVLASTLGGFSGRDVWRIGVAVALGGALAVLLLPG